MNNELKNILSEIESICNHYIPYYAYGDNEAACDMHRRLNNIKKIIEKYNFSSDKEKLLQTKEEIKSVECDKLF
jgi:hypothetical protein